MPRPGRAVRQSRIRVTSALYEDTEEVIRAIEELERSSPTMYYKDYGTLRDILLQRGIIEPTAGHIERSAVLVASRANSPPRGTAAVASSARPNSRPRSEVEGTREAPGLTRRLEEECRPYRMESIAIRQRIGDVSQQIIDLRFLRSYLNPKKQQDTKKMDQYMLEILQKQEEILRLRDRLIELSAIVENIHRQYEVPYVEQPSAFGFGGGSQSRTRKTKTRRRHKWSLKYKRSIDCKHPKGFSQKQHCKYGRKKMTRRK